MTMVASATDTIKLPGKMVIIPEDEYESLLRLKANAEYLAKLDQADEQIRNGQVVIKTLDELIAMEDE